MCSSLWLRESQVAIRTLQLLDSILLEFSGKHFSRSNAFMVLGAIDERMKCFYTSPTEEEPKENNTVWMLNWILSEVRL